MQIGANHAPNNSGNTPLHWASSAGHTKTVKLLLSKFKDIDVLQKNKFGKSALTEGFAGAAATSKDDDDTAKTKTVGALLEHDTATEDRLIGGAVKSEADGQGCGVTHEFLLQPECSDKTLLIREMPIAHADNPFGANPHEDTTGLGIWCASLVMARWMASPEMGSRFQGKNLCELGAGCAIPGLAAALYCSNNMPNRVYLTDLNEATMKNMRYNVEVNSDRCQTCDADEWISRVQALTMDWGDKSTWPAVCEDDTGSIDFVIGSDLIYQASIVPLLKQVIVGLLRGNDDLNDSNSGPKSFLYVAPDTGRDGLPEFIESMKTDGFECVTEKVAPDEYRANPLKNSDADECFLHFNELSTSTYILYEFRKN